MASSSNLRPGLQIIQQFTTISGTPPATNLPVALIGINRRINYQIDAEAGDYNAGTPLTAKDFPNWGGGIVENESAASAVLRPAVFVTHPTFGTAQIKTGVSFANLEDPETTPNFTIAAGASATFEVSSGTSGVFAVDSDDPLNSSFTDASADFVIDRVGDGDVIKVNGVATYQVASQGLVSDDELIVKRLDKGPSTVGAVEAAKILVEPEDVNGIRTLRSTSVSFNTAGGFGPTGTGVKQGDVLFLDHWKIRSQGEGLEFDQVGQSAGTTVDGVIVDTDERVATLPAATGDIGDAWDNDAKTGLVFFVQDSVAEFRPVFYAVSSGGASDQYVVKDYASGGLESYEDADDNEGVAFKAHSYAARAGTGTAGTTGAFTEADETTGYRDFSNSAIAGYASSVALNDHILVKDTDGIYRPVFEIVAFGSVASPSPSDGSPGQDNVLVVRELGTVYADNLSATNVDYVICNPGAAVAEFLGANVSTANVTTKERTMTDTGADFVTDGVAAGDLVFSDAGTLMFVVVSRDSATQLTVKAHPNIGIVLLDTESLPEFGYSIRQSRRGDFSVKRVVNDSTLEITQLATSPNDVTDTQTIKGAIYFQTPPDLIGSPEELGSDILLVGAPDASSSLNYTIEKTLAGAALEGVVKLSYAEIRNDSVNAFIKVTSDTYQGLLGDPVPDNPLALAAQLATQNTQTEVYCLQVASDTTVGWDAAFSAAETDTIYSIVPLTQDEVILSAALTHVLTQSLPTNKRERLLYQSKWHKTQVTRTSLQSGDAPTVSRTAAGVQTVLVNRDLTNAGVIVGDDFSGTAFDGTALTTFAGRITAVAISGATTTLTMIPDGNIAKSTTGLTVTAYTIKSKLLSTTEFRDEIAAYSDGISERRVRNIFPSRYLVTFTDTIGAYGTLNQNVTDFEVGGQYVAAIEAAKRAEYGPARPLTKIAGSGIQRVLDPFSGSSSNQDVVINAGNYYMQQPGGDGAPISTIRALSTDTTAIEFYEDHVATQIDNFVRLLRATIRPILGTYNRDEGFYDVLSTLQQGVRESVLEQNHLKSIKLRKIEEDPDQPDGFIMEYKIEPYFSASQGTIFIFI